MIDIDHFKDYNDHYGHQQGDDCLIRVAAELAAMLQRPTDLLARYGGEEFAAILPDTDAAQALRMAEAIRQHAAELRIPHAKTGNDVKHITVSIGIATQHPQQHADHLRPDRRRRPRPVPGQARRAQPRDGAAAVEKATHGQRIPVDIFTAGA